MVKNSSARLPRENKSENPLKCDLANIHTHDPILIPTLFVKYYNDLLGRLNSERGMDEVTFFYVGDLFCIHLGTKYAEISAEIFS